MFMQSVQLIEPFHQSIHTIHTPQIEREVELDPARQYIFGWHPHGILLLSRFAIYGGLWDKLFPGIRFKVRVRVRAFLAEMGYYTQPTTVVRVNNSMIWALDGHIPISPHRQPQRRRHHEQTLAASPLFWVPPIREVSILLGAVDAGRAFATKVCPGITRLCYYSRLVPSSFLSACDAWKRYLLVCSPPFVL